MISRRRLQRHIGSAMGTRMRGRPLEIVAARVEVVGRVSATSCRRARGSRAAPMPDSRQVTSAYFDGNRRSVPLYERSELVAGRSTFSGPAIVTEDISTTVVDAGWEAEVLSQGELLLVDAVASRDEPRTATAVLRLKSLIRFPGDIQQSTREYRGADGRDAAQHREQRQCEGAARFQLRHFYGRRTAGGQRAACAGAFGGDGGNGSLDDCGESRFAAGRCYCDERSVCGRFAFAGYHGRYAGA